MCFTTLQNPVFYLGLHLVLLLFFMVLQTVFDDDDDNES